MICPICGETINPPRPKEYIFCPWCRHEIDPDDTEGDE